ncbi:hypothetical protein C8T65DRAFT_672424 [Cerioporus squamosus]|nr:hypothetical protein C8T65DRAFT_672424 [Cerioporus squamosus]
MAQDLNPSPPTNEVRVCEARLTNGSPCGSPTKKPQYPYCTSHNRVYKDGTAEYKDCSRRVEQLKEQSFLASAKVKAMTTVAEVEAATQRAQDGRTAPHVDGGAHPGQGNGRTPHLVLAWAETGDTEGGVGGGRPYTGRREPRKWTRACHWGLAGGGNGRGSASSLVRRCLHGRDSHVP